MSNGVSGLELARHLDCSPQWVAKLVKGSVLAKQLDGSFDLDVCRVVYIRWLRSEGRRHKKSAAAARAQEARAQEIELRVARDQGKVIDLDEVEQVFADVLGTYRAELSGIPAGCTRDFGLRQIIEAKLNEAIERCRRRFEEASETLRSGGAVLVEPEEANA
jgi:phage terminase Nu1 subunit (DNA packaging protein)